MYTKYVSVSKFSFFSLKHFLKKIRMIFYFRLIRKKREKWSKENVGRRARAVAQTLNVTNIVIFQKIIKYLALDSIQQMVRFLIEKQNPQI